MTHVIANAPLRPRARVGIFAKTFPGSTPLDVLTQARDAGFDCVQYNMACSGLLSLPGAVSDDDVFSLRIAMRDTGVGIVALSATCNLIHPDVIVRGAGLQSLAILADVAQQIGIPVLTLCTGSRNTADQWAPHPDNVGADAWRDLIDSMRAAIRVATKFDVMLGIEPETGNVVNSAFAARRLLDELQSERVGIIIDAANLIDPQHHTTPASRAEVVAQAVELLADRIVLVHAKDRSADGSAVAPGSGVVDFDGYFGALRAAGVRAPVVGHGLRADEAPEAAVFLRGRVMAQ